LQTVFGVGREVTTAVEEGTLGYDDREHLSYAADRDWTLLTFDDDYLALVESESTGFDHAGVIYVSQYRKDVGELVRRIDGALQRHDDEDLSGRVVYA
jgi:hypothetical protein